MFHKGRALLLASILFTSSNFAAEAVRASVPAPVSTVAAETGIGRSFVPASQLDGQWVMKLNVAHRNHYMYMYLHTDAKGELKAAFSLYHPFPADPDDDDYQAVMLKNETLRFNYKDRGMRFLGQFEAQDRISGTVSWLGRDIPASFRRLSQAEAQELAVEAQESMYAGKKVAVLIFDGVDLLDWAGPTEVLGYAGGYDAYLVAPEMRKYKGFGHSVVPDYDFATAPKPDILIVPGGGVYRAMEDTVIQEWIKSVSKETEITMSVCNGALLLAANGVLVGKDVTTHWAWEDWFTEMSKDHNFTPAFGDRFVDSGNIITTAGVSAGIDGTLHLVARLDGLEHAKKTARRLEYNWVPDETQAYK